MKETIRDNRFGSHVLLVLFNFAPIKLAMIAIDFWSRFINDLNPNMADSIGRLLRPISGLIFIRNRGKFFRFGVLVVNQD